MDSQRHRIENVFGAKMTKVDVKQVRGFLVWKYDPESGGISKDDEGNLEDIYIEFKEVDSWSVQSVVSIEYFDEAVMTPVKISGCSIAVATANGENHTVLATMRLANVLKEMGISETPRN